MNLHAYFPYLLIDCMVFFSLSFSLSSTTTCPYGLRGPPPGCRRSVTDFWGYGAHTARLGCPDDVSDDMYERGVPGGALNLSSTRYSDRGRSPLRSSPARENSHGRTGNRTRDLMVSSQKFWTPSHKAGSFVWNSVCMDDFCWMLLSDCGLWKWVQWMSYLN
jgi:hypothetical protein